MMDRAPRHIVAASALVRRDNGDILLVRTHRRGWELPGGQVELGETLIDGLEREVREESGVRIEVGRLRSVRSNLSSAIVIFCFEASYRDGELTPSDETPEVGWFPPKQALSMVTHPALSASLRAMLSGDDIIYDAYDRRPYRQLVSRKI